MRWMMMLGWLVACTGPTAPTETGTEPSTPAPAPAPTTTVPTLNPLAPTIVSLDLATDRIGQDESVLITAVVDDVDGLASIVGGSIRTADDDTVIAPFVLRGDGVYDVELSWSTLNQTIGIEFEASTQTLDLAAVFFDTSSLEGSQTFPLILDCGGETMYACSGVCVDAASDFRNCGACRNTCYGDCNGGSCDVAWSPCFDLSLTTETNCGDYCATLGEVCADDCTGPQYSFNTFVRWSLATCSGGADYDFETDRCTDSFTWDDGSGAYRGAQCCCSSGAVF